MKRIKRMLSLLLVGGLLLMSAVGCGDGAAVRRGPYHIGVCLPSDTDAKWLTYQTELEKALSGGGHTVDFYFCGDDAATQAQQLRKAASDGCRSILLVPCDVNSEILAETVDSIDTTATKIIALDRLLLYSKSLTAFVTFDLIGAGRTAARQIEGRLSLSGGAKATVELITTPTPDGQWADNWYNGAMGVLRPYLANGQLTIVSGQENSGATAAADREAAAARYQTLVENGVPDAVLCSSDLATLGVMDAVAAQGEDATLPFLTGFGALEEVTAAIKDGKPICTAFGKESDLCASAATVAVAASYDDLSLASDTVSYYNGSKLVPTCAVSTVAVTFENIHDVIG